MKMFLTRIGFNSKAVVTGDVTQVDLPPGKVSGLREASRLARSLPACTLTWGDVDQIGDRIERWTQSEAFASARDRHLR
jgi:hypothetical protein